MRLIEVLLTVHPVLQQPDGGTDVPQQTVQWEQGATRCHRLRVGLVAAPERLLEAGLPQREHSQIDQWVTSTRISEVQERDDASSVDQDMVRLQVTVYQAARSVRQYRPDILDS